MSFDATQPVPFADLTTTRVGGPPEKLYIARSREELIEYAKELIALGDPLIYLGGGSNTIMRDEGYAGNLLLIRSSGIEVIEDSSLSENEVRLRIAAGHDWDSLVAESVNFGAYGLEPLSGIPGSVGAAPMQNIGAYGAELKDFFHSLELLDEDSLEVRRVHASELNFKYRSSALKTREISGLVISVDLVLPKMIDNEKSLVQVNYPQLASALGAEVADFRHSQDIRQKVLELRASKGMVLDEEDHDTWSTGSFFMNPVVSERFARSLPPNAPRFPVEEETAKTLVLPLEKAHLLDQHRPAPPVEGRVKLSAAWLIENAGIKKGFALPGSRAKISSKHTLAITNSGGAKAEEIAELARFVMALVRSEYGVLLVPEPNLYGLEL